MFGKGTGGTLSLRPPESWRSVVGDGTKLWGLVFRTEEREQLSLLKKNSKGRVHFMVKPNELLVTVS